MSHQNRYFLKTQREEEGGGRREDGGEREDYDLSSQFRIWWKGKPGFKVSFTNTPGLISLGNQIEPNVLLLKNNNNNNQINKQQQQQNPSNKQPRCHGVWVSVCRSLEFQTKVDTWWFPKPLSPLLWTNRAREGGGNQLHCNTCGVEVEISYIVALV